MGGAAMVAAQRIVCLLVMVAVPAGCRRETPVGQSASTRQGDTKMEMTVSSQAFEQGGHIPRPYTGEGEDISPPLAWSGVPGQAAQLAVLLEDPDAPGGVFVHWLIYHLAPDVTGLPEALVQAEQPPEPPGSAQGRNSFGKVGYNGPMPPRGHGPHRYYFHVYALDRPLDLKAGSDAGLLRKAMQGHILAQGTLMGVYERK